MKWIYKNRKVVLIISAISLFLLYMSFFLAPFYFDDFYNISENYQLNSLVTAFMCKRGGVRPLAYLWFYFDKKLLGLYPPFLRLENIAIHVFNFLIVFSVFKLLLEDREKKQAFLISFFASIVWAFNPINSQSVAYIVQRMNQGSTLFVLIGFFCYLRFLKTGKKGFLFWLVMSFFLSLGFKETGVLLIPLILLHYTVFVNVKKGLISFLLLSFFSSIFILFVPPFNSILPYHYLLGGLSPKGFTIYERILTAPKIVLDYLLVFLFPLFTNIHLYYSVPIEHSIYSLKFILPLAFELVLLSYGFFLLKNEKVSGFSVIAFFLLLFPESFIIPIDLAYQHRMYLPSVFLSLFVVSLFFDKVRNENVKFVFMIFFSLFLVFNLVVRGIVFSIPTLFYKNELRHAKNNRYLYVNASKNLLEMGKLDEAVYYLKKGLSIFKGDGSLEINSGLYFAKIGDVDRAIYWYDRGLKDSKRVSENALYSLAYLYLYKGENKKALDIYVLLSKKGFDKELLKKLKKMMDKKRCNTKQ